MYTVAKLNTKMYFLELPSKIVTVFTMRSSSITRSGIWFLLRMAMKKNSLPSCTPSLKTSTPEQRVDPGPDPC